MNLGLRAKSILAFAGCIVAVLVVAGLAGWRAIEAIEVHLGTAYATNYTQFNRARILAPIERELALSQQMASSEVTRGWIEHESDPDRKRLFFAEADQYRKSFDDHSYFVISRSSLHYYFNDRQHAYSNLPRYSLNPAAAKDNWFFKTMRGNGAFNLNVDVDSALHETKVWFNVPIRDRGENIGLAGTGLDLTSFLQRFIKTDAAGVTPMIVGKTGLIQAHPRHELIDYSSVSDSRAVHSTLFKLLDSSADRLSLRQAMQRAEAVPGSTPGLWLTLDGRPQFVSLTYVPDLSWFVVTAVDLKAARLLAPSLWVEPLVGGALLLLVLVLAILFAVDRLLLSPVLALTRSVRSMSAGDYAVKLPPAGDDELGELTRSFGTMAAQVQSHTDELERRVEERTHALVEVNEQITAANRKLADSIQYASLIQDAILPRRELSEALGDCHFVLWRPRDVVGGDFYIFRAVAGGYLLGVVDCAGHGVPGAFMTMIAHAVINMAVDDLGPQDPAAILTRMDTHTRAILQADERYAQVATRMDAGFAFVNQASQTVTFAGAKVSLYSCDGHAVQEVRGDRYAIGGKREGAFANRQCPLLPQMTYYLTTDGLLDQAGGSSGFSFGQSRFEELLLKCANEPLESQLQAFDDALADYQGNLPQRDDITVLSFRSETL